MATEKEMHELVGRAVMDATFRQQLLTDPAGAATAAGYELTAEQLAALQSADGKGIAALLEDRLPKSFAFQGGISNASLAG
jgi:hypothetical protein